jgi:hypothetical protein
MAFFCPLSWSVIIVMSPESIEGCNSSAYFQNCLQVLVLSSPKIIAKATGDALEFAVTP